MTPVRPEAGSDAASHGSPTGAVGGAAPLLLLGGVFAVALAWSGPRLDALLPAAILYTGLFIVLLRLVWRHGTALDGPWILLGGAALLRLLFLAAAPDLSVDPYRYLWDGWLTADGVNPYRYTPSDPSLVDRHGAPLFAEMNSRDFHSIYPPLSQWLFLPAGLVYERLGGPAALLALKATMTAAETVGVLLLFFALRAAGRPPRHLALYAWNPLVLVTVAGTGHSEAGLVLALGILALGLTRRGTVFPPVVAWGGLGLAAISKGIPLLLAPLLIRHHRGRLGTRRALAAAVVGLIPAALLSLPFVFPGLPGRVAGSADLYVRLFEFNAGLFAVLTALLDPLTTGDPRVVLGPFLRALFLSAALVVWLRHPVREGSDVLRGALLLFGLYLVTATTVHPWYLLWGLPLVTLTDRHRRAWLWCSWAAFLTYFAYVGVPGALPAAIFWGGAALFVLRDEAKRLRDALLPAAGRRKARGIEPHLLGRTVLDLGAGEGYVGQEIAARGWTVFLADIAPFFRVRLPGLAFDGRRLPLPDRSVDTVVLSLVLHHAEDPDALLCEALRVARLRVLITESTYLHDWERKVLETVDRWVNEGRGTGAMAAAEVPLLFDTPGGWGRRIAACGGGVTLSRRLNRVGHRHHLFVVEPSESAGGTDASPKRWKSSARSPSDAGGPPPLDRSRARNT